MRVGGDREQLGRSPGKACRRSARARAPRRRWFAARPCRRARLRAAARRRSAPARRPAAGDRDHVGGGAAAVEQDRVGQRARDQQRRRHPVGGRALQRRGPRRVEADQLAAGGHHPQPASGQRLRARRRARGARPRACSRTRRRARRSWSARPARRRAPAARRRRRSRRRSASGSRHTSNGSETIRTAPVAVDHRRLGVGAADVEPDHRVAIARGMREDTRTMRIVPVLDLKGGIVVHARRGQRADYAPLRSPLVDGCEPVAVARALCAAVPDAAAVRRRPRRARGRAGRRGDAGGLASVAEIWVDAGATTPERAAALRAPAPRATSSAPSRSGPRRRRRTASDGPPLVLSVDLRDGRLISPRPALAGREPAAAAPLATSARGARAAGDRSRPRRAAAPGRRWTRWPSSRRRCPASRSTPAAACVTTRICARSRQPGPPARWWPRPCTRAASRRDQQPRRPRRSRGR